YTTSYRDRLARLDEPSLSPPNRLRALISLLREMDKRSPCHERNRPQLVIYQLANEWSVWSSLHRSYRPTQQTKTGWSILVPLGASRTMADRSAENTPGGVFAARTDCWACRRSAGGRRRCNWAGW